MCPSDVGHVNIVPDAGSIGRPVVRTVELDSSSLAHGCFDEDRDEMGFVMAVLAVLLSRPAGIEVPERDVLEAVDPAVPFEDLLELQLGKTIWAQWMLRCLFCNDRYTWVAVDSCGRREDDPGYARPLHRLEQLDSSRNIDFEVQPGISE